MLEPAHLRVHGALLQPARERRKRLWGDNSGHASTMFQNWAAAGVLKHAFCASLEPSSDGGLRVGNAMPLCVQLHATQVSHVHGWISHYFKLSEDSPDSSSC